MKIYSIANENDIVKDEQSLYFPIGLYLRNIQDYINNILINYAEITLDRKINLVVENGTYLTIDTEVIYKPICNLLNVKYHKEEKNNELHYYSTIFGNKLTELSLIKKEEDLLVKFPYIHALYKKREEQIKNALDIYSRTNRVIPSQLAKSTRAKYFFQYKLNENLYNQLLVESQYFNLSYFLNGILIDMTNLVNSLPMLISNVASIIIDTNTLPNVDEKKIAAITNKDKLLKR